MKCPECKLENPDGAELCKCGYDFSTGTMPPPYATESVPPVISKKQCYQVDVGAFAMAGGAVFFVLSLLTAGDVPGGMKGGFYGGLLGGGVATIINSMKIQKR